MYKSIRYDPEDKYDYLCHFLAVNYDKPQLCSYINPKAYTQWGGIDSPGGIALVRSECYYDVALNLKEIDYCNHVKTIRTLFLKSIYNKSECLEQVRYNIDNDSYSFQNLSGPTGEFAIELVNKIKPNYKDDPDFKQVLINEQEYLQRTGQSCGGYICSDADRLSSYLHKKFFNYTDDGLEVDQDFLEKAIQLCINHEK